MRLSTESERQAMLARFDETIKADIDSFFRGHGIDPLGAIALTTRHVVQIRELHEFDPGDVEQRNVMVTIGALMFALGLHVAEEAATSD